MKPQFPVLCSSKPLEAGLERDVVILGHGQQNTVVMPLKCLSKDHCIFKKEEDSWILEDCSYSSIKINGNTLCQGQKRKLCDQDVIKLDSSNELVYTFTANVKNSTLCKKRRADEDNLQKDSSNKKKWVLRSHLRNTDKTDVKSTENEKLMQQIMLDKEKEEKQICEDYAVRIEKLKGPKTPVKRQKALLKMQRDIQLNEIRAKFEDKISSLTFILGSGQQNTVMPLKCLSKDHCIFKKEEDSWILENCSYSSIKINGNTLWQGQKRNLCDQDVIKLDSSNELVYTFTANVKNSTLCKKRRADEDNLQKDSSNKKKRVLRSHLRNTDKTDVKSTENEKLMQQIMLDKEKKEKQICEDYAVRIEKLKGPKRPVKRRKALLKMQRDIQLKEIRAEFEDKISSLTAKQNDNKPPEENNHSEEETKEGELTSDSEVADSARLKNAWEKDNKRQKEREELRKLRGEIRQLKLDKEKELKEMEKQKLHREKELKEEYDKVTENLAKEKRRVERLLSQKEELKEMEKQKLHREKELKEEYDKVTENLAKEKRRVEQLLSQKELEKLDMESELMCSICSELFIHATTLGCSHSYCRCCIRKWAANRNQCPICRATIKSKCSSIVLDSLIDKMAGSSEDGRIKRQQLVIARDEVEVEEVVTALMDQCRYLYRFRYLFQ